MQLADKLMLRSYHLMDYGWTPLSQNPTCLARFEKVAFTLLSARWYFKSLCSHRVAECRCVMTESNWSNMTIGRRRLWYNRVLYVLRVASVLRSIEIHPWFDDLVAKNFLEFFTTFSGGIACFWHVCRALLIIFYATCPKIFGDEISSQKILGRNFRPKFFWDVIFSYGAPANGAPYSFFQLCHNALTLLRDFFIFMHSVCYFLPLRLEWLGGSARPRKNGNVVFPDS